MADPHDPDRDDNPFKGTPMEQFFTAFTGGGGTPDFQALMNQVQRMFAPHEGHVNFDMAKDVARHVLAAAGPDPTPHAGERSAVDDALRLAEMWLDTATDLPAGATRAVAWSKAEWVEQTSGTWHQLVEPIAEHVVKAVGDALPAEARAMAGPLVGMLSQAGGAMFGQQVGQALGTLAGEVLSSTDVGLPLGPERTAAVLPANVRAFGEGLEHSEADVLLYVVLREAAHQRLFAHAPWLAAQLVGAVEDFGRGVTIDVSAIESQLGSLDPSRPDEIAEALQGGLFEPARTPQQEQALQRLETMLALVEGWVDEVVTQATKDRMPAAVPLAEAMRRRRAEGGPAEQTFATLVGLELRPRRLRDAANLWAALRDAQGPEVRDAVWSHPDLLPTVDDLDDPIGFAAGENRPSDGPSAQFDAQFDEALGRLLDEGDAGDDRPAGDDDQPR
ncbi:zinc-dependent metalloprotease [Aeromicrobium massiliense]|uniref:zinc-dependent metalloprotease n=1 Tax=Aeromicrobium massiliense TaxID=1464554 RepID=UPI0002F07231|nr:zinc-dependent metalloprotease [Aeromicrobium massiliense]